MLDYATYLDLLDKVGAAVGEYDEITTRKLMAETVLDGSEWFVLGDKASLAMATGLIDLDTANALHAIHTVYNDSASLAERVLYMQVMGVVLDNL